MSFVRGLPKPVKIFIGLILGIILFICGCEWKLGHDLDNAISKARAAGYVTELDDFKKLLPTPSPGKDSAPLVKEVIQFYRRKPKARIPYEPLHRYRPSAQDYAELKPFEPVFDEAADLIRRFQGLEPPDMKRDWNLASQLDFHDNPAMYELTTLACKKANLLALRGRLDDALILLSQVMYSAELFGNEPTQMSLSTRVMMESKALGCLNEILYQKIITKKQYQLVKNIGAKLKPLKPIEFYMQSNIVFARLDYQNGYIYEFVTTISDNPVKGNAYSLALRTSFSKVTQKTLFDIESNGIQLAKTWGKEPRTLLREMHQCSSDTFKNIDKTIQFAIEWHIPYYDDDAIEYLRALIIRDMFDCLNNMTVKEDPFGSGRYVLKKVKNGKLLYSLGQFGQDNGGVEFDTFRGSLKFTNSPAIVIPDVK